MGARRISAIVYVVITVGIVAFEILGYQVLVKILPVLPKLHTRQQLDETHALVEKA